MPRLTLLRNLTLAGALVLAVGASMACGGDDDAARPAGTASPSATAATRVTPAAAEVKATEKEDGQEVRLARGGKLTVSLPSNLTTGYAWKVAEGPTPALAVQYDRRYDGPQSGAVGAGGTEVFTFTAATTGNMTLTMAYVRSFEPPSVPPARTYTLKVRVE